MFVISYFRKKAEKKAIVSLAKKVQEFLKEISWAENGNFQIERICDFFNSFESWSKTLTPKEWQVAPMPLRRASSNSGRMEYGWFRAPEGQSATIYNTYIQPTGHFDENFYTHTVAQLLGFKDKPSDQDGFAKRPMTNKEFYFEAFVKPFVVDKYDALKTALKELS